MVMMNILKMMIIYIVRKLKFHFIHNYYLIIVEFLGLCADDDDK